MPKTKPATFGNVELARKMVARFGLKHPPIKTPKADFEKYSQQLDVFVRQFEETKKKTASSTLRFGFNH